MVICAPALVCVTEIPSVVDRFSAPVVVSTVTECVKCCGEVASALRCVVVC